MALDREEFLFLLEDSFSAYYNIIKDGLPAELPMSFRADFFQRAERYWLSKNIPIYGNETNEYVYVFSAAHFSQDEISRCIQYALDDGLPRVRPHKEHQYTNIKTVFVADAFDADALKDLSKRRFQKSYHFSLWGYSSLITASVIPGTEEVCTNAAGRDMKKYFSKLFSAQKKK